MKRYEGENPPRESFSERVYGDLAADSFKINFHAAIVCFVDSFIATTIVLIEKNFNAISAILAIVYYFRNVFVCVSQSVVIA